MKSFKNFLLAISLLGITHQAAASCPTTLGARILARDDRALSLYATQYKADPVTGECEYYAFQFGVEDPKNSSKTVTYIGKEIYSQDLERVETRFKDRLESAYQMRKWDGDISELSYILGGWVLAKSKTTGGLIWRGVTAGLGILGCTLWVDIAHWLVKGSVVVSQHGVLAVTAKPMTRKQQRLFTKAFSKEASGQDIKVWNRTFNRIVERIHGSPIDTR